MKRSGVSKDHVWVTHGNTCLEIGDINGLVPRQAEVMFGDHDSLCSRCEKSTTGMGEAGLYNVSYEVQNLPWKR